MLTSKILSFLKLSLVLLIFQHTGSFCQSTNYTNTFDYRNINAGTLVPVPGLNDAQKHIFSILRHSFDMQHIISHPTDTSFCWNGLCGRKTIYANDSLILFYIRPNDTVLRPCILLTHGNNAKYRSSWNEQLNFHAIDLAMRGYCVAYYENPSSFESKNRNVFNSTRKAFYNGFQSAVAADIHIMQNAALLRIDTSKLFSGGLSFGAFCSLSLASADIGKNFTDTLFNEQGNFSAKALYSQAYAKNIKCTFAIGGGLPKDDTLEINNSKMGLFLDEKDNGLSILFLHGRKDNLVLLDLTMFGSGDTSGNFYTEGPGILLNQIQARNLAISAKLFLNCRGGHPFLTSVCSDGQPNCIQQYQWPYLNKPPDSITATSPYFTNNLNDTLLHYFAYMATQVDDVDFIIADFLQAAVTHTSSIFSNSMYFIQPQDTFTYADPSGHYVIRETDCEGNAIVITHTHGSYVAKDSVMLYPNPSNNIIRLESTEWIQNIRVYSMLGVLVNETSGNDTQQIDVSGLSNGEYICILQMENEIITKKISVIR